MTLGWKVLLPVSLGYVMIIASTILVLDYLEVAYGFVFGLVLTAVSGLCTIGFLFFLDRDRVIAGAAVPHRLDRPVRMPDTRVPDTAIQGD